jgi:Cys-Gly metallodipeptidase DUG1
LVIAHLEKAFAALKSKNKLNVEGMHGGKPWVTDHRHWNFEAAKRATKVRWRLVDY